MQHCNAFQGYRATRTSALRLKSATCKSRHDRSVHKGVLRAYQQSEYHSGQSSSSNLGVLQQVIEQDAGQDDPYGMQRVSVDSFNSRGFYLDGTSILSSLLLLVILLGLTFQRILGLDRFIDKALRDWKDHRVLRRRSEVLKAREGLEGMWDKDETK